MSEPERRLLAGPARPPAHAIIDGATTPRGIPDQAVPARVRRARNPVHRRVLRRVPAPQDRRRSAAAAGRPRVADPDGRGRAARRSVDAGPGRLQGRARAARASNASPSCAIWSSRLDGCVNFDGRKVLYSWIGATRRDWRGQGHFRALTEQSEAWAVSLGYREVVVKTKNRFYDMRAVLAQLGFDVIKFERAAGDAAESKVYLSKQLRPDLVSEHRSRRTVVQADARSPPATPRRLAPRGRIRPRPRLSSPEAVCAAAGGHRFCTEVARRGDRAPPARPMLCRPRRGTDGKARTSAQEDPVAGSFRRRAARRSSGSSPTSRRAGSTCRPTRSCRGSAVHLQVKVPSGDQLNLGPGDPHAAGGLGADDDRHRRMGVRLDDPPPNWRESLALADES